MSDLKPCPFCGQELPKLWQSGGYWKVKCVDGCSIAISGYLNKEGAINAWNKRPQQDARIANLEHRAVAAETAHESANTLLVKAEARVAELEAERRWVPVDERLPKVDHYVSDYVSVWIKDRLNEYPDECCFVPNAWKADDYTYQAGWYRRNHGTPIDENVTHWRELPAGPEAQG